MTVFERAAKKLLALLPFDGDKTKIGSVGLIYSLIEQLLTAPGLVDALAGVVTSAEGLISAIIVLMGLFHKKIKAKE